MVIKQFLKGLQVLIVEACRRGILPQEFENQLQLEGQKWAF